MAIVSALIRVDGGAHEAVRGRLSALTGVTVFTLDEPDRMGLVIEAPDMDAAHAVLCDDVETTEGVLGAWPAYAHLEPDGVEADAGTTGHE